MADFSDPNYRVTPEDLAIGAQRILFYAHLFKRDGNPAEGAQVCIQYYDGAYRRWVDLLRKLSVLSDGMVKASYTYADKGSPVDEISQYLLEMINVGGMPNMRLVNEATAATEWPEVYAVGGLVYQNQQAPGEYEYHFGSKWMTEGYKLDQRLELDMPAYQYAKVALDYPEKTNPLYPAIAVALQQTDALQGYVAGETEVVVQAVGTSTSEPPATATAEEQYTYFSNQLAIQQTQIDSLKAELATKELEATQLYQDLTASQSEVESLQQVVKAEGASAPISSVYEQMVTELDSASATLATREAGTGQYKLGSVSINLKTLVSLDQEGKYQVQMLDASKATKVNTAAISDMKINILSKGDTAAPANPNTVPQLVGFTETAVRQRLIPLGLKLVPIYQTTESHPYGQAFQQKPAQGSALPADRKVTVIFAKESSQFN